MTHRIPENALERTSPPWHGVTVVRRGYTRWVCTNAVTLPDYTDDAYLISDGGPWSDDDETTMVDVMATATPAAWQALCAVEGG